MHPRAWRLSALILAVVLAGGLALVAVHTAPRPSRASAASVQTAPTAATQATTTTVRRVRLLDAHGHLRARYSVASTRRGYCWTTSFVNGHLYRCFQGNTIRDPCWKESGRYSVVCPSWPWSSQVTRLRLTEHLPGTARYGPRLWGLRAGGGVAVSCVVSMAAGGMVENHPISYVCQRGWVLLGAPNRSKPLWTMLSAKRVKNHYELRGRKPLPTAWEPVVS